MTAPTEVELTALRVFREQIKDIELSPYQNHDMWLLRWLRARELDVERAGRMLRRSLQWRTEENIDCILKWNPPEMIMHEFHMKLSGFDDDDCPIGVIPFGSWDIRKVVEMKNKDRDNLSVKEAKTEKDNFIKYIDQLFEFTMQLMERRSTKEKIITQFVMIMDLERFSFRQIASRETIDAIFEAIKRFEANHPETLKAAYLVNAPRVFAYLFSFIRPLLTARTLSKVQIFGSNGSQWKPVILKNIPADQLPSELGGSNTTCTDYTVAEGFDRFDHPMNDYGDFPESEMTLVTVEAGKKYTVNVSIEIPHSRLSWGFKTDKHDIGFAVLNPQEEELILIPRTDSNAFVQKGSIMCESAGTYFLVFDNRFSRFRSKQLRYSVCVKKESMKNFRPSA